MLRKLIGISVFFIIATALFVIGLQSEEIIGFEARFYVFALEMWRHGPTWFPTTYRQPYPDYPGLSTYLIYLAALLFGHLNKLTAILPSAMASAGTVCLTYLIGETQSRKWGLCAAFFLFLTFSFVAEARTISLDQYITFITACCFYLMIKRKNKAFYIPFFLLGFFIRGPIGLVIPAGLLCVNFLFDKNIKEFFSVGFISFFVLVVSLVVLGGMAYSAGGKSFVCDVLHMEVLGRMNDPNHMPPRTFYLFESIGGYAITFPFMIFILIGLLPELFKRNISEEIYFLKKCFIWILVVIVGLSIPSDKKMRYILSIAPALALICAYPFAGIQCNSFIKILKRIMKIIISFIPLLGLGIVIYLMQRHLLSGFNNVVLMSFLVLLQGLIILVRSHEMAVLAISGLSFFIVYIQAIESINLTMNRTRDFVVNIEAVRNSWHAPLVFFEEDKDGIPIKYLANASDEVFPLYVTQSNDLLKFKTPAFVVVRAKNFSHLTKQVFQKYHFFLYGKIGHDDVMVLRKFC